jgi:hypothetical protein
MKNIEKYPQCDICNSEPGLYYCNNRNCDRKDQYYCAHCHELIDENEENVYHSHRGVWTYSILEREIKKWLELKMQAISVSAKATELFTPHEPLIKYLENILIN